LSLGMSREREHLLQTIPLSVLSRNTNRNAYADHSRHLKVRSELLELRPLPVLGFETEILGIVDLDG